VPGLDVDPAASRCLPQPNGLAVSGIRLNLAGREPSGMVAPGVEAEALAAEVTRELLALIDERTSRPAVRRVLRTRSCYDGPWLDELPDLLVEWSDEVPTGSAALAGGRGAVVRLSSEQLGTIEGANRYARTGEHRTGGMFVAAGPGLPAGRLARVVSVLDYAPTIARLVGERLADADGIPIEELAPGPS
jgi:predicted AlkP superfamily phosphohydrolase/phosphomutase